MTDWQKREREYREMVIPAMKAMARHLAACSDRDRIAEVRADLERQGKLTPYLEVFLDRDRIQRAEGGEVAR